MHVGRVAPLTNPICLRWTQPVRLVRMQASPCTRTHEGDGVRARALLSGIVSGLQLGPV